MAVNPQGRSAAKVGRREEKRVKEREEESTAAARKGQKRRSMQKFSVVGRREDHSNSSQNGHERIHFRSHSHALMEGMATPGMHDQGGSSLICFELPFQIPNPRKPESSGRRLSDSFPNYCSIGVIHSAARYVRDSQENCDAPFLLVYCCMDE